uniref:Uncharacterized protein n=1 Tax=viral metagenome TaxID=1070528 RepID=A0A6M3Y0W8_9ZZZZ
METPNKSQGQKPYRVLKIDELVRPGEAGGVERYYRHTIKTRGGTTLSVDIDEEDFSAERAAPILEKKAVEADKILTG